MTFIIIYSLAIAYVLFIWLKLDTIEFYFPLKSFKLYKKKNKKLSLKYPEYLNLKYNNFLTKLVSCPFCLAFWWSLILFLISWRIEDIIIYTVATSYGSSFFYLLLSILYKKYNE